MPIVLHENVVVSPCCATKLTERAGYRQVRFVRGCKCDAALRNRFDQRWAWLGSFERECICKVVLCSGNLTVRAGLSNDYFVCTRVYPAATP